MCGFLARPWTTSRIRFTDPILALVIVSLVRLGDSATNHNLRRRFATDCPRVPVQVAVNIDVVTVRG